MCFGKSINGQTILDAVGERATERRKVGAPFIGDLFRDHLRLGGRGCFKQCFQVFRNDRKLLPVDLLQQFPNEVDLAALP